MWRVVLSIFLLLGIAGSVVYMLDRMELIDVELYVLERLQNIPAYADYAATYQLGLERRSAIEAQLAALERERLAWREAESSLAEREAQLELERRRLELERLQLEQEREALRREWEALQERYTLDDNLDRLVGYYEQMSPEEVAAIAAEMSDTLLIRVLLSMSERKGARVLAHLDAERAARISSIMAGDG